jgi:hypothetical protein
LAVQSTASFLVSASHLFGAIDRMITITELETAINYWRSRSPAVGEELRLCAEAAALAKPYALMIVQGANRIAPEQLGEKALAAWEGYARAVGRTA